jgi:serine/threonine protein kinase
MAVFAPDKPPPTVGRYVLHGEIASGGMATVHFGRLRGAAGFTRSVAIKRLHPQFAKDPDFVAMFVDEARLAARIAHPNVVPTLDIVSQGEELLLIMEYVRGASFSRLLRTLAQRDEFLAPRIATSIVSGVLHGLHAAHEARSESGAPLDIVHRDVSPQNVLVGTDGVARVLDFGVAKAAGRLQSTREGQLKGKLAYMAPEQITTGIVTRKTDIYAAAVVLWEALTGTRLFQADNEAKLLTMVLDAEVQPPSSLVRGLPPGFDRVVMKGLERDPAKRFATAREMASEVERVVAPASSTEVGEWVERLAADELRDRANRIQEIERSSRWLPPAARTGPQIPPPPPQATKTGPQVPPPIRSTPIVNDRAPGDPEHGSAGVSAADLVTIAPEPTSEAIAPTYAQSLFAANRWVILAAAAVAICAIGAAALFLRPTPRPIGLPAAAPAASSGATVSVTTTTTPTSTWVPIPTASAPSIPPPAAVPATTPAPTSAPAPPYATRPLNPARPIRPATDNARQTGATARPSCNPPYTTDDKGHVHFKPACMN